MALACPYCQFSMSITGAKPGRYTPACQQCHKKFLIIVHENASEPPTVKTFEEGRAEAHKTHAAKALQGRESSAGETTAPITHAASATRLASTTHAIPAAHDAPSSVDRQTPPPAASDLTGTLGGYALERKIGVGGMGAVYLARQISLDRPVAVKVMNAEWAGDPEFVARFTREAFAAAQLTHHNIVQIYDIGLDRDIHFFSMEFVPGKTLSQLVKTQGRLDPEVAASYTLQTARGLKFAHDHGMIHRDIKPENLLLNEQGIVKVLDLGLVKTPDKPGSAPALTHPPAAALSGPAAPAATQVNMSMGTPEYMSPEQALDAAGVDARADIYSLGCSLYDLVVGRPPFTGKTIVEVLSKQINEPVIPPEVLVKRVPPSLSQIVQRMVAKKREDRFPAMEAVIKELETFLGISSTGPFSPTEEHATLLEKCVLAFNKSPLAMLARHARRAVSVLALLCIALLLFFGHPLAAGAIAGMLVLSVLAYQIIIGITRKTHVFTRVRQLAFGARIVDWLKFAGLAVLAALALWIFGLLWVWIGVAIAAVALALALALGLDVVIRRQRQPLIDQVQALLRTMRLKGLEEDALRQFVCKYSGPNWEEFFEQLFGYEAKMQAREAWGRGEGGRARKKYAPWRDNLIAWAQERMQRRRETRERALLEKLEEKSLRAKGAADADARRRARESADWMVDQAAMARDEKRRRAAVTATGKNFRFDTEPSQDDLDAAKRQRARLAASRYVGGNLGLLLLGPRVRLILGAAAMAICLLWLQQNDALHPDKIRALINGNVNDFYRNHAVQLNDDPTVVKPQPEFQPTVPLNLPLITTRFTPPQQQKLFNSLAWGIAGLLLIFSSFYRGIKISFLMLPATAVMVAGNFVGIPPMLTLDAQQIAYLLGGALAFLAFWTGKERG